MLSDRHRWKDGAIVLLGLACWASHAKAQSADDGDDPTRPVTSIDLRTHFEDDATTGQNDRLSQILRTNFKWSLGEQWNLAARFDLPLTLADAVTDANPDGGYQLGLGRPLAQAYVADILGDRWAFAMGSQLVGPASSSAFGSGNWEIVPIMALRYMLPEFTQGSYFVPQLRYAVSFAQSFSGKSTNNLQLSPQLKIVLPQKWFVILFPSTDIRLNFGTPVAGQTGRLFLPADAEIGRNLGDASVISLEASVPVVRDYPVYRIKFELRFSVQV